MVHDRGVTAAWAVGRSDGWLLLRVGLARHLCGLGLDPIGERVGLSRSQVSNLARWHARLLASDPEYASRASVVAGRALGVWESGGK